MGNSLCFVLRFKQGQTPLFFGLALMVWLGFLFGAAGLAASDERLTYTVTLSGLEDSTYHPIRKTFNAVSLLKTKSVAEIVSVTNLRATVKSDADLLRRILRSEGYYSSVVTTSLARSLNNFQVTIHVDIGPLYSFGEVQFDYKGAPPEFSIAEQIKQMAALKGGQPAVAASFVAAEARVRAALRALGFPFAKTVQHDLVVDHKSKSMNVTFVLEIGQRRQMGDVRYKGLTSVKERYLARFTEWKADAFFEQSYVAGLRTRLMNAGLFSSVDIEPKAAGDHHVDLLVTVVEAEHKTISLTAGYSTSEGFGGEASWTNRAMFERGGSLKVTARAAEIEQSLANRIELPHFLRLDQTLAIESLARRQSTDAFLSYEAKTGISIDRILSPQMAVFVGAELDYSDVTDAAGSQDFLLASLPSGIRWDTSDDLLNPSRGFRASLALTPTTNLGSDGFSYLKSEVRASSYFPLMSEKRLIAALRIRMGSIVGPSNDRLPATQRFFSGGGGSVRGYGFQKVGVMGTDGSPFGGRSVAEVAGEIRFKVSDTIGFASFVEGGNTYENAFPTLSDFRWGAGSGVRYYTSFGPIRFDVAFPLDRREGESSLQFYISLGQAF